MHKHHHEPGPAHGYGFLLIGGQAVQVVVRTQSACKWLVSSPQLPGYRDLVDIGPGDWKRMKASIEAYLADDRPEPAEMTRPVLIQGLFILIAFLFARAVG